MKIVTKEKAEQTRNRILQGSRELFYAYGYRKISMDMLARKMGMSKKTFYRYFKSKYDIMSQIVMKFKNDLGKGVNEIVNDTELDFPAKLRKMLNFIAVNLSGISPLLMEDLQKSLPDLWEELNQLKRESAFERFDKLIDEGRRKSMINTRINRQIIVALYASAVQNLLDPNFIKQLPPKIVQDLPNSPSEIFDNMISIIYEGILTEDTKKKFAKYS